MKKKEYWWCEISSLDFDRTHDEIVAELLDIVDTKFYLLERDDSSKKITDISSIVEENGEYEFDFNNKTYYKCLKLDDDKIYKYIYSSQKFSASTNSVRELIDCYLSSLLCSYSYILYEYDKDLNMYRKSDYLAYCHSDMNKRQLKIWEDSL